ncbi:alpha/beta hydrolase [Cognatiyoonia sp. IB215182]|uniref:alpha/beta fold hydrolase n=1 Tax=Cognatiyoonia sp. IB215182 TaxID=3097353 RepID=UPI002A24C903|nr:alpha/beta hydrolase [Cognatiyoonia sp. IB215182]
MVSVPPSIAAIQGCRSLWLHGAGLAGQTWQPLCADLPHAVAPDLPGHGDAAPTIPPTVESYANRLLPMLEEGMVLIGHSLGGMVALELAARSPIPLGALVMVEAVATVRDRWMGRVGPSIARPFLKCLPMRALVQTSGFRQSQAASDEARRWLSRLDRNQILGAFDAARSYDGRGHLAEIDLPTLVIVGAENQDTHRGARFVVKSIKNAEFQVLRGGHLLHIDNPDGLRNAIGSFLLRRVQQGSHALTQSVDTGIQQ